MFSLFKSSTPGYVGEGQPASADCGGIFGFLGRLFGGTPTYRGEGQPASSQGCWGWFSSTPAYKAPPAATPPTEPAPQPEPDVGPEPEESPEGAPAEPGEEPADCEHGEPIATEYGEPLRIKGPVTIVIRR
jgi:hypothetical protein